MDIKKSQLEACNLTGGEFVRVVGTMATKYNQFTNFQVKPFLNVSHIEPIESSAVIASRKNDQANLEALKKINPERHIFPFKSNIKISILCSRQSEVFLDLTKELVGLSNVSFEQILVNMTSPEEIAAGIMKSTGDVLVIIRGGGNSNDFECFNSTALLTEINKFQGYRILGIGHSSHTTLADCVCDYSASTPTRAGVHIKEMFTLYSKIIQAETTPLDSAKRSLEQANSGLIDRVVGLGQQVKDLERSKKIMQWFGVAIAVALGVTGLWIKLKMG
jgi:exonuclease VII large subunit